ncbi:MAG: aminoacyl-tRNA hydrolase [Pseudomonadota bacterium]
MSRKDTEIQLIVGLGNPGPQYELTRHNAGAWFVERLAQRYNVTLKPDNKYHGLVAKVQTADIESWLLIPTTFMNLSGKAVLALAQFYKIPLHNILVAHDELDLDPGTSRLKFGGGHGGHNGLRDIIQKFSNSKEFHRLRIGIGHPGSREQVHNWVLGKAPKSAQIEMDNAIDDALAIIQLVSSNQLEKAMNQLHQKPGSRS